MMKGTSITGNTTRANWDL